MRTQTLNPVKYSAALHIFVRYAMGNYSTPYICLKSLNKINEQKHFVAINYLKSNPEYRRRFEFLSGSGAGTIDRMPGFVDRMVLKPNRDDNADLKIFAWQKPGEAQLMISDFKTCQAIAR